MDAVIDKKEALTTHVHHVPTPLPASYATPYESATKPSLLPPLNNDAKNHEHKGRKIIAAEKAFDIAVYGLWNYGIQVGAAVGAAMWFNHGSGKPYFEKAQHWLGDNVISKVTNKTGAAAAAEARTPLIFTSLITVGNLFVLPMPYLEQHKAHYVSKINDWMNQRRTAKGDAPGEQELAEQRQAIEHIEEAPKQTASSLWTGRALGLLCNYAATTMVGNTRNEHMEQGAANLVSKGLKGIGATELAKSENVRNVAKIAFLDYGYSTISSNVIYLYSHYLHPHSKEEKQEKDIKNTPSAAPAAAMVDEAYTHIKPASMPPANEQPNSYISPSSIRANQQQPTLGGLA